MLGYVLSYITVADYGIGETYDSNVIELKEHSQSFHVSPLALEDGLSLAQRTPPDRFRPWLILLPYTKYTVMGMKRFISGRL